MIEEKNSQEKIQVEVASGLDLNKIFELVQQLGYHSSQGDVERRIDIILSDPNQTILTASIEGHIIGWMHLFIANRVESDSFTEIGGFVVDEDHRGIGAGKKLLEVGIQWASERTARLRVRTNTQREGIKDLYENLGFKWVKDQHILDLKIERSSKR